MSLALCYLSVHITQCARMAPGVVGGGLATDGRPPQRPGGDQQVASKDTTYLEEQGEYQSSP